MEIFRPAASLGYLPAILELQAKEWTDYTDSYGFAVQLRPFVGKGDRLLDYCFGIALKNGCQIGSDLYYEGLYWMDQSCGIPVKYPNKHQTFEGLKTYYTENETVHQCYDYDGFRHIDHSIILAPSKEAWKDFVSHKLEHVKCASQESYLFKYDPTQLQALLNECEIKSSTSFVESASGQDVHYTHIHGRKMHGFHIYSLSIHQGNNKIGKISVQKDTFKIDKTVEDQKIKPLIDFAENVMIRTGSAESAYAWLKKISRG